MTQVSSDEARNQALGHCGCCGEKFGYDYGCDCVFNDDEVCELHPGGGYDLE